MFRPSCPASSDPRFVGDPVDTLTGAVFDGKLDFRLTGPLEFWWFRHYDSSHSHRRFALGWGHTHDLDRWLRFDVDGFSYHAPVGRVIGFPPLLNDGDEVAHQGILARRISSRHYVLKQHGEPWMEFEFRGIDEPARLKRLYDNDHEIRFQYAASQRLERIIDSTGRTIEVVEEPDGSITSLILAGDKQRPGRLLISYQYDQRGNLISTANASGSGHRFAYDDKNRLTQRTGRKGFCFRFEYDSQGRCIHATGDDRLYEVRLEYEIPGRVTRVTRADGGVWTYLFDEAGGLMQILDPLGGVQQFVRDAAGRLTDVIDPNGNTTTMLFDAAGSPVEKVAPLGHHFGIPEDPNAPDPLVHPVAGSPAEYELGRFLWTGGISLPLSDAEETKLPAEVRAQLEVAPKNAPESNLGSGYPVKPLGFKWWPGPERGRLFNEFGKLVEQLDPWGRRRTWRYDASGNIADYTDFDGSTWTHEYGSWHFLRGLIDPQGARVNCTYTPEGKVASFVDAGGCRSEFVYDSKDQLVEVSRHGQVRDKYTRDAAGNLLAKQARDGRSLLKIEYGAGNLPVKRTLASGDEHELQYDKHGRVLVATTKKDALTLAYDGWGNRVLENRNGCGVTLRFQRLQQLSEIVVLDRFRLTYERSEDGNLVITDPGGRRHSISLISRCGIVERRLSNGSKEFAQYDLLGRCQLKHLQRANGASWSRKFHWSGEGELRRVEDNQRGETRYEYDAAHRLQRRIRGSAVADFEFDEADNLIRQPGLNSVKLLEGNRLQSADDTEFQFNDRNHIESRQTPGGRVEYVYDSRDQLIRIDSPRGSWEADYDALGRRTRITGSGGTTEFYWNDDQLIAEESADGKLRIYVYADELALTPLFFLEYESRDAAPESCQRYFVYSDQLGTPVLVEDEQGKDAWRADVEPFGEVRLQDSPRLTLNLRFPGHYFDAESGLHYNRFRYYDPQLGRYVQSDPWGITGGNNLYAYRTNPLGQADVRGLGEENTQNGKPCHDEEGSGPARTDRQAGADEVSPVTGQPVPGAARVVEHTVDGKVVARYYVDEHGRTIRAEGLLDPPPSRTKEGVGHVLPDGFVPDQDHRGHLIPERSASDQDSVNVPENVIAEHGRESNLSAKKRWENSARDHAEENPGTWSVHEPQYDGDNPRPTSVDHSLYDSDGNEVPGSSTNIPNPDYS